VGTRTSTVPIWHQQPSTRKAAAQLHDARSISEFESYQRIASRLGNHSTQIELVAIKAKHKVPNGGRQIFILPIGVDAGDQVGQGLPALFSDLS
jgi:hypothetical protein